jgi:hypothetical protein
MAAFWQLWDDVDERLPCDEMLREIKFTYAMLELLKNKTTNHQEELILKKLKQDIEVEFKNIKLLDDNQSIIDIVEEFVNQHINSMKCFNIIIEKIANAKTVGSDATCHRYDTKGGHMLIPIDVNKLPQATFQDLLAMLARGVYYDYECLYHRLNLTS